MTGSQYIFTATRFYCGCSYRTIGDTAVFCPEHRAEPHRGFITGEETIRIPSPQPPDILRLGMNKHLTNQPRTLRNTEYNSIYTKVQVMGPGQEEWESDRAEEVGLCAACFIESQETWETGIAMCECGNEDCPYRWCGGTAGLHASGGCTPRGSAWRPSRRTRRTYSPGAPTPKWTMKPGGNWTRRETGWRGRPASS